MILSLRGPPEPLAAASFPEVGNDLKRNLASADGAYSVAAATVRSERNQD